MVTIKGKDFEVKGKLIGINPGSTSMYFQFPNGVEIELPRPSQVLQQQVTAVGLHRLQDAEIDLVKGTVTVK